MLLIYDHYLIIIVIIIFLRNCSAVMTFNIFVITNYLYNICVICQLPTSYISIVVIAINIIMLFFHFSLFRLLLLLLLLLL